MSSLSLCGTVDCSDLQHTSVNIESHNSITSVTVTTVSTLVIELWFTILALVLLQVHCNLQYSLTWAERTVLGRSLLGQRGLLTSMTMNIKHMGCGLLQG